MTKKARFIEKMTTLSNREKSQVKRFFSRYPNYENRIDWNRKSLQYCDFEKVFKLAEKSINNQKRKTRKNPRLLFEKYNCEIICQTEDFIMAVPLDQKCAVFFNSYKCGGEGARWCIGDSKNSSFWNDYAHNKNIFVLVYFLEKQPVFGRKFTVQYNIVYRNFTFWLKSNKGIKSQKIINLLFHCFNFLSIIKSKIKINTKYIDIYSSLFNVIHNEIPNAASELMQKISIYPRNPIRMEIGLDIAAFLSAEREQEKLIELIKNMRNEISKNYGIKLPPIRIIDNVHLEHDEYRIIIKERYAGGGRIPKVYEAEKLLEAMINNMMTIIKYNLAEISLFSEILEDMLH